MNLYHSRIIMYLLSMYGAPPVQINEELLVVMPQSRGSRSEHFGRIRTLTFWTDPSILFGSRSGCFGQIQAFWSNPDPDILVRSRSGFFGQFWIRVSSVFTQGLTSTFGETCRIIPTGSLQANNIPVKNAVCGSTGMILHHWRVWSYTTGGYDPTQLEGMILHNWRVWSYTTGGSAPQLCRPAVSIPRALC